MSVNQSRAEKSESGQYRKNIRSGSSGVQRNYSGGGGKGSGGATAPTPSLSTNRSFKNPSNVQGSQTRVVNSDVRSDATTGGNAAVSGSARGVQNGAHSQSHGGSDTPVGVKPNVTPMQKVNRGVPKAPAPNSTPVNSSTVAPATPAKGGGFPLQFGSISPGLMQVPARTSSAPPNLDEQKREQPSKMQQQQQIVRRTADRRMFSSSDDSAMMKQVQASHAPDGREVDVKPTMLVIEEILRRASPGIDGVINGTHAHVDTLEEKATLLGFDGMLELQAYTIHKVSCELECKCSGGADAHGSTMAILSMLSSYTWEAKIVLSLAAFSVNYGQFWLVAQLYTTNPLAKSVALLKQLPDIIEHSNTLKSQFDAANNLIKAVLDVTKCIIKYQQLPSNYLSPETPPMSVAMALVPTAAYWLIRSLVTCASQLTGLLGMSYQHLTATTETWEMSSLAHKVQNIHEHLTTQLGHCNQHIDEKRHDEYFHMLIRLFETPHIDNMKILKALLYSKDDMLPLVDGTTKTGVSIEVLRRKCVLLLISDLDLSTEQLLVLTRIYNESRANPELHYDLVWIPLQDRSTPWNEKHQQRFEQLQTMIPWYTIHHPTMLEPAVIKFIKEVWHFAKKQILVVLDPQGKVACPNALHMVWIWENQAYPFTSAKEEALWKSETWRLELLVDEIDPKILEWVAQGKYICLYGGEDIDWIRRFTSTAKSVAQAAQIDLKMVYVGKHNSKDRTGRNITTINTEQLSHAWTDLTFIWYFWTRLESMFYSKMQHGKTIENDRIAQEVLTMLTYDSSDRGWALFFIGSDDMAKAKGETLLTSLDEFPSWEEEAKVKGFVPALHDHLEHLHTPLHCNRVILPGIDGGIPEMVICTECGRPMEKYFMYRCCVD